MGLFDYVYVSGPDFVCSEGHDLTHAEFQSKDFGCTMGSVAVSRNGVTLEPAGWGDPPKRPLHGVFEVYASCLECPVFVQAKTGNLVDVSCMFEIKMTDDAVVDIKRVGETTAEFLASTPSKPWMKDCLGPMPYAEADPHRQRLWAEWRAEREREHRNAKPPR